MDALERQWNERIKDKKRELFYRLERFVNDTYHARICLIPCVETPLVKHVNRVIDSLPILYEREITSTRKGRFSPFLMMMTGANVAQISRLKRDDIDLEMGTIIIDGREISLLEEDLPLLKVIVESLGDPLLYGNVCYETIRHHLRDSKKFLQLGAEDDLNEILTGVFVMRRGSVYLKKSNLLKAERRLQTEIKARVYRKYTPVLDYCYCKGIHTQPNLIHF